MTFSRLEHSLKVLQEIKDSLPEKNFAWLKNKVKEDERFFRYTKSSTIKRTTFRAALESTAKEIEREKAKRLYLNIKRKNAEIKEKKLNNPSSGKKKEG